MHGRGDNAVLKVIMVLVGVLCAGVVNAAFDHAAWDSVLKSHVIAVRGGLVTQVDYQGLRRDRAPLQQYLRALSGVSRADFDRWGRNERLAFLINAYNAWTVELILRSDPGLKSIRDLGSLFESPWKKSFIPLFGRTVSLDDIEHGMIRADGAYREPRIHIAVNCASIGCPALRGEAYDGARLDAQLADATNKFLADRQRNRLRGDRLEVSSIFKWYREDFERGWGGYHSLPAFLSAHAAALGLSPGQAAQVLRGDIDIDFLDYDWKLNRKP